MTHPTCPTHGTRLVCPACNGERARGVTTPQRRRASRQNVTAARAALDALPACAQVVWDHNQQRRCKQRATVGRYCGIHAKQEG